MRTLIGLIALFALGAAAGECGDGSRYDPCAGKTCGDPCTACPPGAPGCVEGAVVKACDPRGRCVAEAPDLCAPGDPDCEGKACGEPCNPCGPDRTCPTLLPSACDLEGRCVGEVPWLCHDPCAGKACGEGCTRCPADASGCFETAEVKACDPGGRCVSWTPALACPQ
jgi:hypothetical protein